MIPEDVAKEIIDDFLKSNWHIVLCNDLKISQKFGNHIFILDREGFTVHELFTKENKFDGIKHYYNEMNQTQLELLARLIPEFKTICRGLLK